MPRRKRLSLDPTEERENLVTVVPRSMASHIASIAGRSGLTKSAYVRQTLIDRLRAEGHLTEDDADTEANA